MWQRVSEFSGMLSKVNSAYQACPLTRKPVEGKPFAASREAANPTETSRQSCLRWQRWFGRAGLEDAMRKGLLGLQRKRLEDFRPKNTCQVWLWQSHYPSLFCCGRHLCSASLPTAATTEETMKSTGGNKAARLLQMLFWQACLAVHTHFIFEATVDLMVERYQVSGKQDCWFQLTKNPSLLRTPLHRSVGVLLALVLQCILTTLHTLPTSSKQPSLHIAAAKTKKKRGEEIFKWHLHGRKSNDECFRKRPMK